MAAIKEWKHTNGYEVGETLPPVTPDDNGKVLGVSDGAWAVVSGGGGGGGSEPLMVGLNYDSELNANVADKKCIEIWNAYTAGTPVFIHIIEDIEGAISENYYRIVNANRGGTSSEWMFYGFTYNANSGDGYGLFAEVESGSCDNEYPVEEPR